jgi:hypothetical protein
MALTQPQKDSNKPLLYALPNKANLLGATQMTPKQLDSLPDISRMA